jgi:glycosyltransferase involved in cell wall biosynthesis
MKILLLITGLGVGGAERQVCDLADVYAARGHCVVLGYMTGPARLVPSDPRIRLVKFEFRGGIVSFVRAAIQCRRLIRSLDPDVVHTHLVHANLFARLLRVCTPMRALISSSHTTNEEGWWRMLAYMATDSLATVSTNVSDEGVEIFERWPAVRKGRMIAVHNGISLDQFRYAADGRARVRHELGAAERTIVFAAVGRLSEAKDYPNLLRAIAKMRDEACDLKVVIAGDGPLRSRLETLADELGLAKVVTFFGNRHDVAAVMSAADVFVLSSAWEGLPLVVAEALACERVVVATDCGGVRGMLGECGYVVAPKDADQLATALLRAAQLTAAERAVLGAAARQRVESRYSIESAAETWLDLYRLHRSRSSRIGVIG